MSKRHAGRVANLAAEHRKLMDEISEIIKNPDIPEIEKADARRVLDKARRTRVNVVKGRY